MLKKIREKVGEWLTGKPMSSEEKQKEIDKRLKERRKTPTAPFKKK